METAHRRPSAIPTPRLPGDLAVWVAISITAALVSLLLIPYAQQGGSPPEMLRQELVVALVSLVAIATAFCASVSRRCSQFSRLLLGGAVALSLVSPAVMAHDYYWRHFDYPWIAAVPITGALILAGWFCRQRWLCFALPAFLIFWFHGAMRTPLVTRLPISATSDGVTVEVTSLRRWRNVLWCGFSVKWQPGAAARYDLDGVKLWPSIPPFIPVRNPALARPSVKPGASFDEMDYSADTRPPSWSRSLQVTVDVPEWPTGAPAASVNVPVPTSPEALGPDIRSAGNGLQLTVGKPRFSEDQTRVVPGAVALDVTCSGSVLAHFRATDDRGRVFPIPQVDLLLGGPETIRTIGVGPFAAGVQSFRIDAFTEAQWARCLHIFHFDGLPNGSFRGG